MTTTVTAIAERAFAGVAAKIGGVIKTCTVTRTTQGDYDPVTGQHATTTETDGGQCFFDTSTRIEDALPGYVAGPLEELAWIRGLDTITPKENDGFTAGGADYTIKAVGDVVKAGALFACTVVPS